MKIFCKIGLTADAGDHFKNRASIPPRTLYMIKRVYTGVAYKYKEMKVSYMNTNHNIKGGLKCQILSYNRESMRLFTMIIE